MRTTLMKRIKPFLLCLIFFGLIDRCSKDGGQTPSPVKPIDVVEVQNNSALPTVIVVPDPISYSGSTVNYFDWEKADFVPGPSGNFVPWANGTCEGYPLEWRYDFKKLNGWEMLYSSFNTLTIPAIPYFILYNKYRGLIRMYWLAPRNDSQITVGTLAHKISINGSHAVSSPLLNFVGQKVVDVNTNSAFASIVENQGYPYATGCSTWHILQYELAYDPNTTSQNQNNFYFDWPIVSISGQFLVMSFKKGGVGLTTEPSVSADVEAIIHGYQETAPLNSLSVDLITQIQNTIASKFRNNDDSPFFTGNVNAGSLPMNGCNVLTAEATINFTRQINDLFSTGPMSLAVPGYDQTNTQTLRPIYNEVLGLFNLASRPQVSFTKSTGDHPYNYALDVKSVKYVFNPAVTKIADITNLEQKLIGKSEVQINSKSINDTFFSGQKLQASDALTIVGVRVSFDVVPKDGSQKYRIVKTFKADLN